MSLVNQKIKWEKLIYNTEFAFVRVQFSNQPRQRHVFFFFPERICFRFAFLNFNNSCLENPRTNFQPIGSQSTVSRAFSRTRFLAFDVTYMYLLQDLIGSIDSLLWVVIVSNYRPGENSSNQSAQS